MEGVEERSENKARRVQPCRAEQRDQSLEETGKVGPWGTGGNARKVGSPAREESCRERQAPGVGAAEMGRARVAPTSAPARLDISPAICAVASHGQLETSHDGRIDSVETGKPCTWSSPL